MGRLYRMAWGADELRGEKEACGSPDPVKAGSSPRLGGRLAGVVTSPHTSTFPNTTCNPVKKLSPMTMTVAPPVVQPSLGLMALMQGVAAGRQERSQNVAHA